MKKNYDCLTFLCLAALLSTVSTLPVNADEIISGKNPLNADTTIGAGESYRIEETGHVYDSTYHDYDKPSTADTTLTNNGTIINNGYTDTTGIDIANFINTGIVTSDNGSNGRLYISNGGTNTGSISQNILQISEGTFTNDGTITVGTLGGDVTINRTAGNTSSSLTIDDASYFNGSIDQGTLTINSHGKINITGNLTADTLNNNGEIIFKGNTSHTLKSSGSIGGSLTLDEFNYLYVESGKIEADAELTMKDSTSLWIQENGEVTLNGNDTLAESSTIRLTGGSLDITEYGESRTIVADNGKLTAKNLDVSGWSEIGTLTDVTADNIYVKGGNLTIDDADNISTSVEMTSGSINYYITENPDFKFIANDGQLYLYSGSKFTLDGTNHIITDDVELTLSNFSQLTVVDGGSLNVGNNVTWNKYGEISLQGGSLSTNTTQNGTLKATSGNLTVAGEKLTIGSESSIAGDVTTTIKNGATLDINGGDVLINDNDNWNGTISLTGGTLTTNKSTANGILNATSGNLTVEGGHLKIDTGSSIEKEVTTTINDGALLDVADGGNVILDEGDNWNGTISLTGGNLTAAGDLSTELDGHLEAISGNLDVSSGTLTIKNNSTIYEDVTTTVAEGAWLKIENDGNAKFNDNDNIDGVLQLDGGSVATNFTTSSISCLYANSGKITVTNGTLIVDNLSYILEDVATTVNSGATLIVNGGDLSLDDNNDNIQGTVRLDNGYLYMDCTNALEYGKLEANSGNIFISKLTLNNGSYIKDDVVVSAADASINIENGELNINSGDNIAGATISLNNGGSKFNYGSDTNQNIQLLVSDGQVNLLENSKMTLVDGSSVSANLNIQEGAVLSLNQNTTLTLNNETTYDGTVENNGGWVTINNFNNSSSTSSFVQSSGMTDIVNSDITFNQNNSISGGEIYVAGGSVLNLQGANITGGKYTIDETSAFNYYGGSFNIDRIEAICANNIANVSFNMMNGEINTATIGEMNLTGQAIFSVDILSTGSSALSDQIKIGTLTGNGTLFINDWTLLGETPTGNSILLDNILADSEGNPLLGDNISVTDKTVSGYKLVRNRVTGKYSLEFISSDLPKVDASLYRGQVATIAQWQNQLAIDDMLFNHAMLIPGFKDENGKMANKYAASEPLFAPYQYSKKDGGLWYKAYGTFEHLEMNHDLKVGNNAYGSLIGADFGVKELKNGWQFMPTAYIGYNGAHQYYSGESLYQNGGQAGFVGTWYKDDFIISSLTYGGVYDNHMSGSKGGSDKAFNYFAGTAAKAAYNWKIHKDVSLQPNLMVAYNYFGQQNWHSDFSQAGMMSGMLHGVNIAPGVNLIWEKETFSTYLTLQYMYNVNGAVDGKIGNTDLANVEMKRGYIQYGIGVTKKIGERFSGYLQAVLRNVGRTGVGFQAGFSFKLGKK